MFKYIYCVFVKLNKTVFINDVSEYGADIYIIVLENDDRTNFIM